jgi:thiol-disulfide isomerase/thioredoxin
METGNWKIETRNKKTGAGNQKSKATGLQPFLLSAFGLLLSAFCLLLFAGAAQAPYEPGLTPTNFRAPEFPTPANPEGDNPGPLVPKTPSQAQRAAAASPRGATVSQPVNPPPSGELEASQWINSRPLTMEQLRGHVVLIDFWEYSCINCIRTFAENKKLYERYHKYGFAIIGVHDFEFDIASHFENVRTAVKRFELPYPIFVDSTFQLWQAYRNQSWPSAFLVDAQGVVRFHKDGEGSDDALEHAIQSMLLEANPGLKFPADYTVLPQVAAFAPSCGTPTPEMYVGNWSSQGVLSNQEGYKDGKTIHYALPANISDGQAAVSGPWEADKNGMTYRGKKNSGEAGPDKLEMRYHARELYAVMNVSHGHPSSVYIQQDGKDLTAADKGVDVKFDSQGHSYIEVREPRMYYLVQNPAFGAHAVTLTPTKPGWTVNSFTFGNDCQTQFPHL